MKSIKILHLNAENGWRGGEQQLAYLLHELSAKGCKNFVAIKKHSRFEQHCIDNHIFFVTCTFHKWPDVATALTIKRLCRTHSIDIIHVHTAGAHQAAVLAATFGNPVPIVLSRRVDFKPKSSWLTRWKYNHQHIVRIVSVSNAITNLMKNYVVRPERCITIYSGVDSKRFQYKSSVAIRREFNIPNAIPILGTVGALVEHKDHTTLINALHELVTRGIEFKAVLVGDGPLREALVSYAKAKGIAQHIIFAGNRTDVAALLPGFDVFILSSKEEGLGTSVLDAFASRVPVVATTAGGIPEMVIDRETGMLANIGDANTIARHIQTLLNDSNLTTRLVEGGSRMVEKFTMEVTAQATFDLYIAILRKSPEAIAQ